MTYCPNCSANLDLQPSLAECWNCHATFGEGSLFRPVCAPPGAFRRFPKGTSTAQSPTGRFSESWRRRWRWILISSIPAAALLQILAPVLVALARAPSVGLLCTATVHGSRAVPCSFEQLLRESFEMMLVW